MHKNPRLEYARLDGYGKGCVRTLEQVNEHESKVSSEFRRMRDERDRCLEELERLHSQLAQYERALGDIAIKGDPAATIQRINHSLNRIAGLQLEVKRLRDLLEHDRRSLISAIAHMVGSARSRSWIRDGRGMYEWDDEDYRLEAGWALDDLIRIGEQALAESGSRMIASYHPDYDVIGKLREQVGRDADAMRTAIAYFEWQAQPPQDVIHLLRQTIGEAK